MVRDRVGVRVWVKVGGNGMHNCWRVTGRRELVYNQLRVHTHTAVARRCLVGHVLRAWPLLADREL